MEESGKTCLELETSSHQISYMQHPHVCNASGRGTMADTEGGSLNPDLRIREKGVPGKRTLPKGRARKTVSCVSENSEKHYRLEEHSIPKTPLEHMYKCGN